MPMDRSKYAADWKAISRRIRDRAKSRCEWCDIPNYAVGRRNPDGSFSRTGGNLHYDAAGNGELSYKEARELADYLNDPRIDHEGRTVVIVLTVAHLNHDTTDNRDENLACLCNRCHLKFDARFHASNGKATRDRKAGQLSMETINA